MLSHTTTYTKNTFAYLHDLLQGDVRVVEARAPAEELVDLLPLSDKNRPGALVLLEPQLQPAFVDVLRPGRLVGAAVALHRGQPRALLLVQVANGLAGLVIDRLRAVVVTDRSGPIGECSKPVGRCINDIEKTG